MTINKLTRENAMICHGRLCPSIGALSVAAGEADAVRAGLVSAAGVIDSDGAVGLVSIDGAEGTGVAGAVVDVIVGDGVGAAEGVGIEGAVGVGDAVGVAAGPAAAIVRTITAYVLK